MPDDARTLKTKAVALQRNTAALLKLLGGDSADKLRWWEIVKGITTPAEFAMLDRHITVMNQLVAEVQASAKTIEGAAKQVAGVQKASRAPKAKAAGV